MVPSGPEGGCRLEAGSARTCRRWVQNDGPGAQHSPRELGQAKGGPPAAGTGHHAHAQHRAGAAGARLHSGVDGEGEGVGAGERGAGGKGVRGAPHGDGAAAGRLLQAAAGRGRGGAVPAGCCPVARQSGAPQQHDQNAGGAAI